MKQWNDIIKDRLDGYESPLPEGAFERFHARLSQKKGAKKGLRAAMVTALAAAAAVAAVFFIPKDSDGPVGGTEIAKTVEIFTPAPEVVQPENAGQTAQPAVPQLTSQTPVQKPRSRQVSHTSEYEVNKNAEPLYQEKDPIEEDSEQNKSTIQESLAEYASVTDDYAPVYDGTQDSRTIEITEKALFASSGSVALAGLTLGLLSGGGGGGAMIPWPETKYLEDPIHHLPARIGLTASLPVSDKIRFVSGLEYFLYSSEFNYIKSGQKHQLAHYIGVPLRIDWVPVSIGRADIYLGGGLEGNFCVAASQSGQKINKDRPTLSLLGTCGAQYRITDSFGIYLEPVLSWAPGTFDRLETYSTEHPLMLSVSTGLRFIIN